MRVIYSKFTKTNPQNFKKPGGARPARGSWIRLCLGSGWVGYVLFFQQITIIIIDNQATTIEQI